MLKDCFYKALSLLLFFCLTKVAIANENIDYSWVQYGANDQLFARVITKNIQCPTINIDGKVRQMAFRAEQYDIKLEEKIKVCEVNINNANIVSIHDRQLKLPPKQVNRFIVIGDTGCENSVFDPHHRSQNCDNKSWPFKELADKLVQLKPDFIVHLGDYIYINHHNKKDEVASLKNKEMQWFFYKNDFFDPAKNLLQNVPMLFVRGNHEKCSSAGIGWYAFFDSFSYKESCLEYSPSYKLHINDLNFMIFDSASAKSGPVFSEEDIKHYNKRFLAEKANKPYWLFMHHPVLGIGELSAKEAFPKVVRTPLIEKAFDKALSKEFPVVISGHYHLTAYLQDKQHELHQLIIGNAGTKLNGNKHNSYKLTNGIVEANQYGYTQFDRIDSNNWKVTGYSIEGKNLFSFNLSTSIIN